MLILQQPGPKRVLLVLKETSDWIQIRTPEGRMVRIRAFLDRHDVLKVAFIAADDIEIVREDAKNKERKRGRIA